VGINYTGATPNSSALLDLDAVSGANKGLLIPRLTSAQRSSITSPATSLLIYQTDGIPGFYFNSGTPATPVWTSISSGGGGSSQWTTSGSNIYYNSNPGMVGIGSNTPAAKLHVVGTGTTTATCSGLFNNAAGQTTLYIKDDGKVSVGSTDGSAALDVRAQAQPSTFENLFSFTVKDVPNQSSPDDVFAIINATPADGKFAPLIVAQVNTVNDIPPVNFRAQTKVANDVGSFDPMSVFDAYITTNTVSIASVNKPLAQFRNCGLARVSISPTGSIYSGASTANWLINHTAQLVVASTGTTSSTFVAKFQNNATTNLLVIRSDGKVGIGVSNPSNLLELGTDNAVKPNGGSWSVPSDIRLKKDIGDYNDGLELIRKIKPIKYKYNGLACTPSDDKECVGISAQEMQKILPSMVRTQKKELTKGDADKYPYEKTFIRNDKEYDKSDTIRNEKTAKAVPVYEAEILVFDPSNLVYILINAVKELDTVNKTMQDEVADLKKRLDKLEKK
jgi:Chaperone of endosialidase